MYLEYVEAKTQDSSNKTKTKNLDQFFFLKTRSKIFPSTQFDANWDFFLASCAIGMHSCAAYPILRMRDANEGVEIDPISNISAAAQDEDKPLRLRGGSLTQQNYNWICPNLSEVMTPRWRPINRKHL